MSSSSVLALDLESISDLFRPVSARGGEHATQVLPVSGVTPAECFRRGCHIDGRRDIYLASIDLEIGARDRPAWKFRGRCLRGD
jgi:hypothetical protein